ncbi:Required for respiratory growth protein 9, mitochondrial [Candida viswanathii]|uniref:Required for respiratory growth protein 9, mitochondrial n=1 Tax=Candida viswanathii TaxID=5486 RepID=A0A367XLI3_9ASCO|nr:Required for respiratory growth protein 9, mitochondrial [Candida viswanathii]
MFRLLARPQQLPRTPLFTILQFYSTKPPIPKLRKKIGGKTQEKAQEKPTTLPDQPISFEQIRKSMIKNDKKHHPNDQPEYLKRERTFRKKHGNTPWNPKKKLSRDDMAKLRHLKEIFPHYKTIDLSRLFHISPEAVRRILKSKFERD